MNWLTLLFRKTDRIEHNEERIMTAITDLSTNIATLTSSVQGYEAAVNALVANLPTPTGDDPAVVAANEAIVQLAANIDAAKAQLPAPAGPVAPTV